MRMLDYPEVASIGTIVLIGDGIVIAKAGACRQTPNLLIG
jgi:hypothetical protein